MSRRLTWILLGLLAWLAAGQSPAVAQPAKPRGQAEVPTWQLERNKQLIQVIERDEGNFRAAYRAAEELALYGNVPEAGWKLLIEQITQGRTASQRNARYLYALAAAGPKALPDILKALPSAGMRAYLLISIGRMGPAGKSAIPTLRRMLADPGVDASTKATVRVALASLGDRSEENLAAILTDIRDQRALWPLLYISSCGWINEAMIREVTAAFRKGVENRPPELWLGLGWDAGVLGTLGEKAASAAELLESAEKAAVVLVDALALARVDPKRQEAALRRLLKRDSLFPVYWFGGKYFWYLEYLYILVDGRMSECLVGFLADPDPKVAKDAAFCLEMAGLAAREAAPLALKFVQGKADEDRRAWAAWALGSIAEYRLLPELEATMKREQSEKVRRELGETIRYIRDLPQYRGLPEGWDFLPGFPPRSESPGSPPVSPPPTPQAQGEIPVWQLGRQQRKRLTGSRRPGFHAPSD